MNITEALEKGKGKAVLPSYSPAYYATITATGILRWFMKSNDEVFMPCELDNIIRTDWQPYIKRRVEVIEGVEGVKYLQGGWWRPENSILDNPGTLKAYLKHLTEQNQLYKKALRFYANPHKWGKDSWNVRAVIDPPDYGCPGWIARRALRGKLTDKDFKGRK